jgi:NhaA family Na+:H+ antiporter
VLAALGGMLVPAAIYLALCRRDPSAVHGWAIPVATDIAFSLAVVQVLGRRVPAGLRVFLAAIAVADDLYAILVIAVFYAETIRLLWLGLAVLAWLGLLGMNRAGVRSVGPYLAGAVVLWVVMIRSGVHATLAGAAAAFAVPMASAGSAGRALERELRPFVAFIVLPLFGLLNAGLHVDAVSSGALFDPVVQGVVLGLVVGKPLGVFGVSFIGSKIGLIRLPGGLRWAPLLGMAMLCGIGFTVSLFIADLSFAGGGREAEVKAAVFAASLLSAAGGAAVLRMAGREAAAPPSPRPSPGGT